MLRIEASNRQLSSLVVVSWPTRVGLFETPWLPGSSVHWDFASKNTGAGCHFLLQGIFLTSGIKPGSPALLADSLSTEPLGKRYHLQSWAWMRSPKQRENFPKGAIHSTTFQESSGLFSRAQQFCDDTWKQQREGSDSQRPRSHCVWSGCLSPAIKRPSEVRCEDGARPVMCRRANPGP